MAKEIEEVRVKHSEAEHQLEQLKQELEQVKQLADKDMNEAVEHKAASEKNDKIIEELRQTIAAEALLKVGLETENSDLKVSLKDAGAMMDTTNA